VGQVATSQVVVVPVVVPCPAVHSVQVPVVASPPYFHPGKQAIVAAAVTWQDAAPVIQVTVQVVSPVVAVPFPEAQAV